MLYRNRLGHVARTVVALAAIAVMAAGSPALGAQSADRLSKQELKSLVATAKSPEDHLKLARHFRAVAEEHEAAAAEHEALATEYAKHPPRGPASKHPMGPKSAAHCKYFAEHCRKAAEQMRELAEMHEGMAGKTR